MTMITPSYLGETIEYSSLHACRSTLEDPTVLIDAPAHPYSEKSTWDDNSLDQKSPQEAIMKYGLREWCRRTLGRRLDLDRASPELQEWYCDQTGRNSDRSAAGWSDVNTVLDLRPLLPKIQAPTLILAGEKSPIVGPQQNAMSKSIAGSRLHVFRGYGHGLTLVATQECVQEIGAFWAGVEQRGSGAAPVARASHGSSGSGN